MKFNFIFVCLESGLYRYAYNQLNELKNVYFDMDFPNNRFMSLIQRVHCSVKLNSIIRLPFKDVWIKKRITLYKKQITKFDNPNAELCFVLFADCLYLERIHFSELLKDSFPNCRIVYYFQDLVDKDINKKRLIENPNPYVDLIYSFDLGDAKKYNLEFYDIPYSDLHSLFIETSPKYDVIFCGRAKERLNEIIQVYDALEGEEINCAFYIVGVDSNNQISRTGIHYTKAIDYREYLNMVNSSRCILEIVQKGGVGNTIRVCEARALGKKLLSNNNNLLNNKLYDKNNMKVYESIYDLAGIKPFIFESGKLYEDNEKMYPKSFLIEIERRLLDDKKDI